MVIDVAELVWEPTTSSEEVTARLLRRDRTGAPGLARGPGARGTPAGGRRGRVHDARRAAPGDDAPDRADVRVVAGRRRRGRAGRMARDPARTRQVRGPFVAQDVDVPDPREHREDARASGRPEPARSRRWSSDDDGSRSVPESWFRGAGDRWPGGWTTFPNDWRGLPEDRLLAARRSAWWARRSTSCRPLQAEVIRLRDVLGWTLRRGA